MCVCVFVRVTEREFLRELLYFENWWGVICSGIKSYVVGLFFMFGIRIWFCFDKCFFDLDFV